MLGVSRQKNECGPLSLIGYQKPEVVPSSQAGSLLGGWQDTYMDADLILRGLRPLAAADPVLLLLHAESGNGTGS